jgi:predicted acylesterase/phospholipase RssA
MQNGERGTYALTARNACGTESATLEIVCKAKRALVFSGCGSSGAFGVGAARCLYDTLPLPLRPDIISGSSFGALNAAKLAEGPAALPQLEALWLGLMAADDFYLEPGWFKTLEPLVKMLFKSGASNIGLQIGAFVADFAWSKMLGEFLGVFGVPGWAYTIMTGLYPVITKVIDAVHLIDAAVRALNTNALFINTPLVNLINANINPAAIAESGITFRATLVSLETGRSEVITETGALAGTTFLLPLRDALLASASIPIAFPPVAISGTSLGTEHFIDGGMRNNVPIREAVQAGAHIVYAVVSSPLTLPAKSGFAQAKLLNIAPRALEIMLDEMQADDVGPFRGFGVPVTTITPTFLVHNTLTIDPGLIAINMDYGYMRAFDEAVGPAAERVRLRQMTDEIILLRLDAWTTEHSANGEYLRPPEYDRSIPGGRLDLLPNLMSLQTVRDLKLEIRARTKDRVASFGPQSVPAQPERWWQGFERHWWAPQTPDPWSRFPDLSGNYLEAAPVPPP